MDWTDEIIERLRSLWVEGHSTAEIGRRLGVSKNAVVGKAHRLLLPPRPSPIRRGAPGHAPKSRVPRTVGATLPPLATAIRAAGIEAVPARAQDVRPRQVAPEPARSAPPPLREISLQDTPRGGGRRIACCWPSGEPGTKNFRFCDAPSVAGKPYCAEHVLLAYVKIRERREEAA